MNKSSKGKTVLGEVSRKEIDKSIRMIRQYCNDEEDLYCCGCTPKLREGGPADSCHSEEWGSGVSVGICRT